MLCNKIIHKKQSQYFTCELCVVVVVVLDDIVDVVVELLVVHQKRNDVITSYRNTNNAKKPNAYNKGFFIGMEV